MTSASSSILRGLLRRALPVLAVAAALHLGQLPAAAAVITQTQTIGLTPTDWASTLTFSRFNPALGTLTSVDFSLTGSVDAELIGIDLSGSPNTITVTTAVTLTLQRPTLTTLVVAIPTVSQTQLVPGGGMFDIPGNTNSATNTFTSPPPASDLVLFTGLLPITLPIDAAATTTGSDTNGGFIALSITNAAASVTVTYTYTPFEVVPEPSSIGLFAVAMAGFCFWRRRTRSRTAVSGQGS